MCRLRRLVLLDRFFFITYRLLRRRELLSESEFACLARVIGERHRKHGFLPDHWHAIFFPRHPLTISEVVESIKVGSTLRINAGRMESGLLWPSRFFDRALRTVKGYREKAHYIHLNPVKAGLVSQPEQWPWSSVHDYTGSIQRPVKSPSGLCSDRVLLPADERTRI